MNRAWQIIDELRPAERIVRRAGLLRIAFLGPRFVGWHPFGVEDGLLDGPLARLGRPLRRTHSDGMRRDSRVAFVQVELPCGEIDLDTHRGRRDRSLGAVGHWRGGRHARRRRCGHDGGLRRRTRGIRVHAVASVAHGTAPHEEGTRDRYQLQRSVRNEPHYIVSGFWVPAARARAVRVARSVTKELSATTA